MFLSKVARMDTYSRVPHLRNPAKSDLERPRTEADVSWRKSATISCCRVRTPALS